MLTIPSGRDWRSVLRRRYIPKCFVISEIGHPNTPQREAANRFLFIIDEALKELSIRTGRLIAAERFDRGYSPTIFDQVVDRIVNYELVVAVLANRNPNAHLELGIALAAGRSVEILVGDKDRDLPSDLSNYFCIECDFDRPNDAIRKLADRWQASLHNGEPQLAFGRHDPLAKPRHGVHYLNRFKLLTIDDWSQLLWDAQKLITIATTNLMHIADPDRLGFYSRTALKRRRESGDESHSGHDRSLLQILIMKAAFEGVRVRVMLMSDSNPFFPQLIYSSDTQDHARKVKRVRDQSILNMKLIAEYLTRTLGSARRVDHTGDYGGLPIQDGGSFEFLTIKRGAIYNRVTLTEHGALVTPFHLSEGPYNSELPSFILGNVEMYDEKDGRFVANNYYKKVTEDMDEIYEQNRAGMIFISSFDCRRIAQG